MVAKRSAHELLALPRASDLEETACLTYTIRHHWLLNFISATDYVVFEGKDLKQRVNGMIQEFLRRIFSAGNPKRQLARSFHPRMTNKNLKVSGK